MADIIKKLTRGVKLSLQHIYPPLQTLVTKVTGAQIASVDLEKGKGTFRLNFYIPALSSELSAATHSRGMVIPFKLPPLQEYWFSASSDIPPVHLTGVAFGFDQMSEAAGITDQTAGVGPGTARSEEAGNQSLNISLYSKRSYSATYPALEPDGEVWSTKIDSISFQGDTGKRNPEVFDDIRIAINPNLTYALQLDAPDLAAGTENLGLWSLTVSLEFSHDLVSRDGSTTQNIPTVHNGAKVATPITITTPASNSAIRADGTSGVNSTLEILDNSMGYKYRGGYKEDSTVQYAAGLENILNDASYEVITVPMFGNMEDVIGGSGDAGTPKVDLPFLGISFAQDGWFGDRRIIPIKYPLTIHHALLAVNYTRSSGNSLRPVATNWENSVGVAIGHGLRADDYTYAQVAAAAWKPATRANYLVDSLSETGSFGTPGYDWDLLTCPLVNTNGSGYTTQGKPIFMGQANAPETGLPAGYSVGMNARSNLNGSAPATSGLEQFIEVRWAFRDTDNLNDASAGHWQHGETMVGFGGHYVYLICKKHLV